MVLLHLLAALAPARRWRLVVAHFNHRLRGAESERDQEFVRQAARRLGLAFVTEAAEVRAYAEEHGLSVESAARELRHRFLARVARAHRADRVVLGHHADDQVETFFLRLCRGSGAEGLGGMRATSPSPADAGVSLLRPFLEIPGSVLAEYARTHRIRFRHDSSNDSTDAARNWVRHRLLPALERRLQPALRTVIRRLAETAGAEGAYVAEVAEAWLRGDGSPAFSRLPPAVQRKVVQSQLRRLGLPVSFELVEQLREGTGQARTVGPGRRVWRDSAGRLQMCESRRPGPDFDSDPDRQEVRLQGRAGEARFEKVRVRWRVYEGPPRARRGNAGEGREDFDADRVGSPVVLRHWQAGDRFQPSGMPRPVKLQDLFVNAKVPRTERHRRVLGQTAAGEVFWVEGLRISERFKCRAETGKVLAWSWWRLG